MARFTGGVSGAAPLQLQLKAPADRGGRIYAITAGGETSAGSASRPVLSRPSTIGTASTTITPESLDRGVGVAVMELGSAFSAAPTTPGIASHSSNLPMRFEIAYAPGYEFIVAPAGAAFFYAAASGGHTWSGNLYWEEI